MATYSFEEAFTPGPAGASPGGLPNLIDTGRYVPPDVQAARDSVRAGIVEGEMPGASPSDLEALKKERASIKAPSPAKPKGELPFEAAFAPAPDTPQGDLLKYGPGFLKEVGIKTTKNLASIGDMVLGLPAQVGSVVADMGARMAALVEGKSHAQQSARGTAARETVMERFGFEYLSKLAAKLEDVEDPSQVDKVMGKVMEWVGEAGDSVEKKTGGVLNRGDIESLANTAMAAFGAKGAQVAGKKYAAKFGPQYTPKITKLPPQVEPEAAPLPEPEVPKGSYSAWEAKKAAATDNITRLDRMRNAELKAQELMQSGASLSSVEQIVKRSPLVGEAMAALRERRGMVKEARLGDIIQGEVLDPAVLPPQPRLPRGPREVVGEAREVGTPPLRLPAAAGAAGLAAYAATQDGEDGSNVPLLATAAAGVGLARRGMDLDALRTLPDATPLASILDKSSYSLKTINRLPANRFEFGLQQIGDLLKQQDVSGAEREIIGPILERAKASGRTSITAKELMEGVKEATQDWETTAKKTDQYASYGLENIDRLSEDARDPDALYDAMREEGVDIKELTHGEVEPRTTLYRLPEHMEMSDANHFGDSRLFGWTRSFDEGGVRHVVEIQSDLAQHAKGAVMTPEQVQAHLKEWGKVEKAHKELDSLLTDWDNGKMSLGELKPRIESLKGTITDATLPDTTPADMMRPEYWLRRARGAYRNLGLKLDEMRAKYDATAVSSQLSPILKNWPRRLIKEEMAKAAEERATAARAAEGSMEGLPRAARDKLQAPPVIRFATADTVAKVEGWDRTTPERIAADREMLRRHEADGQGEHPVANTLRARIATEEKLLSTGGFRPEHQSIYDRYAKDITRYLKGLGGKEVTDAQGHTWIEVPLKEGAKPTEMLSQAAIGAAVGAAAWAFSKDDDRAAMLASLPFLAVTKRAKDTAKRALTKAAKDPIGLAEDLLGEVSTRIGNISQPVLQRARLHALGVLQNTHQWIEKVDPFLKEHDKVKGKLREELDAAIISNDPRRIQAAILATGSQRLATEWNRVRETLDAFGGELKASGVLKDLRKDYFPRIVKDYEGLLEAMGRTGRTRLEELMHQADLRSRAEGRGSLSDIERSEIINRHLRSYGLGDGKPSFAKGRVWENVPPEVQAFYASPAETLHTYFRRGVGNLENRKFFGKDGRVDAEGNLDLTNSIGDVIRREKAAGGIKGGAEVELAELLNSYFTHGQKAPNGLIQDLRNVGYMVMADPASALIQPTDIFATMATQGMKPTLAAAVEKVTGRQHFSSKDFGLVDHLSAEFVSTRTTARFLNNAYKMVGLTVLDRFGKDVLLNAAWKRMKALSQSERGTAALAKEFGEMYGDQFPALLDDLRAGRVTENTKLAIFHKLSAQQPISLLEMPKAYLDSPNGRILYSLKGWMLKQADLVRTQAYNQIKAGNRARGLYNLAKIGLAFEAAGLSSQWIRNWVLGRENDFESKDAVYAILQTFGWSEFMTQKAQKEGARGVAASIAIPPAFDVLADLTAGPRKAAGYNEDQSELQSWGRTASHFPWGRTIESRFMGGAERRDAAAAKRKEAELSKEEREAQRELNRRLKEIKSDN